MPNVALNKPIQIGSKIVIVRETDNAGIYGVYQVVAGERRDTRLGWVAVQDQDGNCCWMYHTNQDAAPVDYWNWRPICFDSMEAVRKLIVAPLASQDPLQDRAMAPLKSSACSKCGASIVWLTDDDGKSVTADEVTTEVILEDGEIIHGRRLHSATCTKR